MNSRKKNLISIMFYNDFKYGINCKNVRNHIHECVYVYVFSGNMTFVPKAMFCFAAWKVYT